MVGVPVRNGAYAVWTTPFRYCETVVERNDLGECCRVCRASSRPTYIVTRSMVQRTAFIEWVVHPLLCPCLCARG